MGTYYLVAVYLASTSSLMYSSIPYLLAKSMEIFWNPEWTPHSSKRSSLVINSPLITAFLTDLSSLGPEQGSKAYLGLDINALKLVDQFFKLVGMVPLKATPSFFF
jgi:hypothetical protein